MLIVLTDSIVAFYHKCNVMAANLLNYWITEQKSILLRSEFESSYKRKNE